MSSQSQQVYEFGPFRLEAAGRKLLRNEEPVPLTPKAFDTLLALVRKSGRLVCKEELMREVWPHASVEESNLSHNVYLLRKALGRNADGNLYIETVPKHGYRLVAQVKEPAATQELLPVPTAERSFIEEAEEDGDRAVGQRARMGPGAPVTIAARTVGGAGRARHVLLFSCALLICAALFSFRWMEQRKAERASRTRSIAVLPFRPIELDGRDNHLGLAVTDATIKKLGALRQFAVRATSAVYGYTDRKDDSLSVGRRLGVDAVLEGVVQRAGDDVRVTVQLVDVGDGRPLWAQKFDARYDDMLAGRDAISEQVAEALKLELTKRDQKEVAGRDAQDSEAYQSTIILSLHD